MVYVRVYGHQKDQLPLYVRTLIKSKHAHMSGSEEWYNAGACEKGKCIILPCPIF